ncbi:MAG: hypothetical protein ACRYFY_17280 [Janthinobacterium lividum]
MTITAISRADATLADETMAVEAINATTLHNPALFILLLPVVVGPLPVCPAFIVSSGKRIDHRRLRS